MFFTTQSQFKTSLVVTESPEEETASSRTAPVEAQSGDDSGDELFIAAAAAATAHTVTVYDALSAVVQNPDPPHGPLRHSSALLSRDIDLFTQIDGLGFKLCVVIGSWENNSGFEVISVKVVHMEFA